jgi:hypothetical protein
LAIEGVSRRYFETLGVRPALGQVVGAREVDSVAPVATISFRCWQTRFGADPTVIGQSFRLQGELVTVIGVAPRAFTGLEVGMPADAWVPASLVPRLLNYPPGLSFFSALVGRLRPGGTLRGARSQIETLWPSARQAAAASPPPEARNYTLGLQPRIESGARGFSAYGVFYRHTLLLLVLSSAITLVLSCANLSGLLLARWSTREVDLAVQALGVERPFNRRVARPLDGRGRAQRAARHLVASSARFAVEPAGRRLTWLGPDYRVLLGRAGEQSPRVGVCCRPRVRSGRLTDCDSTRFAQRVSHDGAACCPPVF